jgi:hypothetical protein
LRNHLESCNKSNCPCKTYDFNDLDVSDAKLLDRTAYMVAYKRILLKICVEIIKKRLKTLKLQDQIDISLMRGCMLLFHSDNYMIAFSDLTAIRQGRYDLGVN